MDRKAPKPLIEIRYKKNNAIMCTEWMYTDSNNYSVTFKKKSKAENYMNKSLKYSSWDTIIQHKTWQPPSIKPSNGKISTKKTKKSGKFDADEYLRAKLKRTNPYKMEDVGSTVDFSPKKPKKKNWAAKWF